MPEPTIVRWWSVDRRVFALPIPPSPLDEPPDRCSSFCRGYLWWRLPREEGAAWVCGACNPKPPAAA